jgi:hypothetical protein
MIGICVFVMVFMMFLSIFLSVIPIFMTKANLDTYAVQLVRTAEIYGCIGTQTTDRATELSDELGISPDISWNTTGNVQLGEKIVLTLRTSRNLAFTDLFDMEIPITSVASGRSEVYHK